MQDITFGITTFNRPRLVADLVHSILHRYPHARIVVADNGNEHAIFPDDVQVMRLPFDCGLSVARNALIDSLRTRYLLVLEDDFLFTKETHIEPLREILERVDELGCVGGAIRGCNGRVTCYALDIEVCRDTMRVREATHRTEITPSGIPYRYCDMVWNFALFRKEMLDEHRWIDVLKIGEHCPFFYEVKLARRWRVASCSIPKIYHVPVRRPPAYLKYRRRAADYFQAYLAARGIRHYERMLPYHYEDDVTSKPPVLVLAVGHSGTSVATRMLQELGWNLGTPVDKVFAEHITLRRLNREIIETGHLDHRAAIEALQELPRPWAIKDPRFVQTLRHWLPVFAQLEEQPVLLRLRRNLENTKASYRSRHAPGDVDQRINDLASKRDQSYENWPWRRFTLEFERVAAAVAAFDMNRFHSSQALAESQSDGGLPVQSPSGGAIQALAYDSRNLDRPDDVGPLLWKALSQDSVMMAGNSHADSSAGPVVSGFQVDSAVPLTEFDSAYPVTATKGDQDGSGPGKPLSPEPTVAALQMEIHRHLTRPQRANRQRGKDGSES